MRNTSYTETGKGTKLQVYYEADIETHSQKMHCEREYPTKYKLQVRPELFSCSTTSACQLSIIHMIFYTFIYLFAYLTIHSMHLNGTRGKHQGTGFG